MYHLLVMAESDIGEPIHVNAETVSSGLILTCREGLYDIKKFKEEGQVTPRFTVEQVIDKITQELKEPGIASVVKGAVEDAKTSEDKWLIASTTFAVVQAIRIAQSPNYNKINDEE
jgi:hypothetical protein